MRFSMYLLLGDSSYIVLLTQPFVDCQECLFGVQVWTIVLGVEPCKIAYILYFYSCAMGVILA